MPNAFRRLEAPPEIYQFLSEVAIGRVVSGHPVQFRILFSGEICHAHTLILRLIYWPRNGKMAVTHLKD